MTYRETDRQKQRQTEKPGNVKKFQTMPRNAKREYIGSLK